MDQETPVPPPVDPWAEATMSEEATPQIIYAPAPWEAEQPTVPAGDTEPVAARTGAGVPRAAAPAPQSEPLTAGRGDRTGLLVLLVVVVTALMLVAGIVLGKAIDRRTTAGGPTQGSEVTTGGHPIGVDAGSAASGPASAGSGATSPTPPGATASMSLAPLPSGRPNRPDDALRLSDEQAATELTLEANENGAKVTALAGSWVPQVDGKCVGVSVDVQPSWIPDGTPDIAHVTVQEILAFHLSLHSRFGALTVRQSQLGIGADVATSGPCTGETIWNSVVPHAFTAAAQANAWCDVNVPPVHECLARYIPKPGEKSQAVERG